ncbi:MAG: S26 family signal peptidase [Planctomycetaceae bacterium]
MELSILFVMAIILLRGFILEGYLISTGSMAPGLLGLHKRISCPSCGYSFAFGVTFDESTEQVEDDGLSDRYATCPNCGQTNINVHAVPVNHGDQLLVHKGTFDFRAPRRWETVVFRNPASPGEAYVKRITGLPGETLRIVDGDLFVNGSIARKDLATMRDMRIPVFDPAHTSDADEWQLPWQTDSGWVFSDGHFRCDCRTDISDVPGGNSLSATDSESGACWLKFHYWRWAGGSHVCEAPVIGDPQDAVEADWLQIREQLKSRPAAWATLLDFDTDRQVLRLRGVMPYQMQQDLLAWAATDSLRNAVYRLGATSHLCPVTDRYGYNSLVSSPELPIHDLMIDVQAAWSDDSAPERIFVRMPLKSNTWLLILDIAHQSAALIDSETRSVVRKHSFTLPSSGTAHKLRIEMSNFDRRITVAVNGHQLFEPVDVEFCVRQAEDERISDGSADFSVSSDVVLRTAERVTQQNRLAVGVSGGEVTLESLQLFRDVHYTPGRRRHAVDESYTVPEGQYFVQGDNSPVSSDSRNWPDAGVPHHLLVGKPFIVHLPSRPGRVTLGGVQLPIRLPDFGRIRRIH